MVTGVAQVNVFGSQKFAVRDRRRPDAARVAADRDRPGRAGDRRRPTSTGRPARCTGPDRNFVIQASGQLLQRRRLQVDRRRLAQRQPGPPERGRATSTPASRTSATPAGTTVRARSTWRSSGSRGRTRSRWWTASRRCCRSSSSRLPASVQLRIRSDRAGPDPRVGGRREVHARSHRLPRRPGDLPVPAQPVGDDHPEPGAARSRSSARSP